MRKFDIVQGTHEDGKRLLSLITNDYILCVERHEDDAVHRLQSDNRGRKDK
jgi:hypothetical protein